MGTYRFSLVKTRHRKSSHHRASDHCVLLSVELRRSAVDQPSTGVAATAEVKDDLLQASAKGKSACRELVLQRCWSTATGDFFYPLKKLKLNSSKDLKAVTKFRAKDVVLPIRLDLDVFVRMALLG